MSVFRGPWSSEEIREFLENTVIPVRVAVLDDEDHPRIASLWFVPEGDALWCAVQGDCYVARRLEADPRCGFEVAPEAPPYHGVRAKARASIDRHRGEAVLLQALERYLGDTGSRLARWLLGRADTEVALRLEPLEWSSWDYRERMGAGP